MHLRNRLRTFIAWFVGRRRIHRRLTALEVRIEVLRSERIRAERDAERYREEVQEIQNEIGSWQSDLEEAISKLHQSLDQSQSLNKRLETALEAAGDELKTRDEIVIPGLIAADKALTSRWETEAAIQAMKQAVAGTESEP